MHSKHNETWRWNIWKWSWVREWHIKECQCEISPWHFQQLRRNSGEENTGKIVRRYWMYPLNKHLSVVYHSPEEDGVRADVVMVFQFPSAEQRAIRKKKIHSILKQKIRITRALSINASSVQVHGK